MSSIAYQSKLCSLMTTFNLQETIAHLTERISKVYCSLLDAKSAFDSVWQDRLFVKLFKLGVMGKCRDYYDQLITVCKAAYATTGSCHSGSNLTNSCTTRRSIICMVISRVH